MFLPVRSVGVMGDGRRYDYVITLRTEETIDFMTTARWAHIPYDLLDHCHSTRPTRSVTFSAKRAPRIIDQRFPMVRAPDTRTNT